MKYLLGVLLTVAVAVAVMSASPLTAMAQQSREPVLANQVQVAQSAVVPLKKPERKPESGTSESAVDSSGYVLEGFRSAKFGMTEAEVIEAIKSDFGVSEENIGRAQDPKLQTRSVLARVSNLIGDTGEAIVGYVFGYQSKKLAQINVLWNRVGTPENGTKITAIANSLRDHLLARGYQPGTVVVNAPLENGNILVFRGRDAYGRMTELLLTVRLPEAVAEGQQQDQGVVALRLSYVENPEEPDVFSVEIDKDAF